MKRAIHCARLLKSPPKPPKGMLQHFEDRVSVLARKIDPEPEQEISPALSAKLRHIISSNLEKNLENKSLNMFFDDIFSGLDSLTGPRFSAQQTYRSPVDPHNSPAEMMKAVRSLYYHGKLTYKMALSVLRDPRIQIQDTEQLALLVGSAGPLLHEPTIDADFFQLSVANKLWQLGAQDRARKLIKSSYKGWEERLVPLMPSMSTKRLRQFVRAIVVCSGRTSEKLLHNRLDAKDWASLYVVWAVAVDTRRWSLAQQVAQLAAPHVSVFGELKTVATAASQRRASGLAPLLALVPRATDVGAQIASVLGAVAGR